MTALELLLKMWKSKTVKTHLVFLVIAILAKFGYDLSGRENEIIAAIFSSQNLVIAQALLGFILRYVTHEPIENKR